jgi:sugar lactone lactonase YvrE
VQSEPNRVFKWSLLTLNKALFKMLHKNLAIAILLILGALSCEVRADFLYVTLDNDTVVKWDVSKKSSGEIEASRQLVASSNLSGARGLAFDSSGDLYVANENPGQTSAGYALPGTISVFDKSGNFKRMISSNGIHPYGIAFDQTGNLAVAHVGSWDVTRITTHGGLVSTISNNVIQPINVITSSSGGFVVANYAGNSGFVSKFDANGTFESKITEQIESPWGMAIDSNGTLFVANRNQSYISRYDSAGNLLGTITSFPPGFGGQPIGPTGMTFDSQGNFYVGLSELKSIAKFNSLGEYQLSWSVGAWARPQFLVTAVPEPSSVWGIVLLVLLAFSNLRLRQPRRFGVV